MLFPTFQNPKYVKKKHNEGAKNQPEGQLGSELDFNTCSTLLKSKIWIFATFSLSCENHMLGICYFLIPCEIWMLGVLLSIYISQGMVFNMLTNNHK